MHRYSILLIYLKWVNTQKVPKIEKEIAKETILYFKRDLPVFAVVFGWRISWPWGLVAGCSCEFAIPGITGYKLGLNLMFTPLAGTGI